MEKVLVSLGFFVLLSALATFKKGQSQNNVLNFFVAGRNSSVWSTAFSISATFLYAFGIIFSSVFAYTKGWAGITWFVTANFLALAIVGIVGYKMLQDKKLQSGFNFTDVIKSKYQNSSLTWYFRILFLLSAVYAITANLTGVGIVVEYLAPGIDYNIVLSVISLTVLIYTLWGGLQSSIRTDVVQMLLILSVSIIGVIAVSSSVGGFGTVLQNWNLARPIGLFDSSVVWQPGILLIALLAGGSLADNSFYQRVYALNDRSKILKSFLLGAIIIAVSMGGLGILAGAIFSTDIAPSKPHIAGLMMLEQHGGLLLVILFLTALLSASSSTIDSALNSAGSIIANDICKPGDSVKKGRYAIAGIMFFSWILGLLKIDLWILITTFGVLRLTIVLPILYTVVAKAITRLDGWFILSGIIADILFLASTKAKILSVSPIQEAYIGVAVPMFFIVLGRLYQNRRLVQIK